LRRDVQREMSTAQSWGIKQHAATGDARLLTVEIKTGAYVG